MSKNKSVLMTALVFSLFFGVGSYFMHIYATYLSSVPFLIEDVVVIVIGSAIFGALVGAYLGWRTD